MESGAHPRGNGGCRAAAHQIEIKNIDFVDALLSVLHDLPFIRNEPLKSVND